MDAEEITIDYWTRSAKGYKKHVEESFNGEEEERWLGFILSRAPEKRRLRILDIGTGPGFFTIILNRAGHECVGIDATEAMIEAARDNAKNQGVKATFRLMNADDLDFPDGSFDLVVSRNVTWTLPDMEQCYREWRRVLAPGGVVLVVDANYYCNQFDDAERKEYLRLMRQDILEGTMHDDDRDDFHIRAEYWETRPMAGTDRPRWDANVLHRLRYVDIIAEERPEGLQKPGPKKTYSLMGYFAVSARKPHPDEYDSVFLKEYWEGISGCMSAHSRMALDNGSADAFVRSLGIPDGCRALDVGCGGGAVTIAMRRSGIKATGADYDGTVLEMARMNDDGAELVEADACNLPFADGSFDAVVMRNVAWALFEPEKAYREAWRVLKDGGTLLVADGPWKKALAEVPVEEMPMLVRRDLGFGGTAVMEDIMSRLPLSQAERPGWDASCLEGIGFEVKASDFKDPMLPPSADAISGRGFLIKAVKRPRASARRMHRPLGHGQGAPVKPVVQGYPEVVHEHQGVDDGLEPVLADRAEEGQLDYGPDQVDVHGVLGMLHGLQRRREEPAHAVRRDEDGEPSDGPNKLRTDLHHGLLVGEYHREVVSQNEEDDGQGDRYEKRPLEREPEALLHLRDASRAEGGGTHGDHRGG